MIIDDYHTQLLKRIKFYYLFIERNLFFKTLNSLIYANNLNSYAFNVTVKMFIILNIIFNIFLLYLKYNIGHEIQ